jgi:uncharacterized membrane protein
MDLLLYLLPVVVFVILSLTIYNLSSEKNKENLFEKILLPSGIVSLLVFMVIKFKDSLLFNSEPMKTGNYFDHVNPVES